MWDLRQKLEDLRDRLACIEKNFEQEAGSMQDILTYDNKHKIGKYINGAGVSKDFYETVTSLTFNPETNFLSYTNEDGVIQSIDLNAFTNSYVITSGSIVGNNIVFLTDTDETIEVDITELLGLPICELALDTNTNTLTFKNEEEEEFPISLGKYNIASAVLSNGIATFNKSNGDTFTLNLTPLVNDIPTLTGLLVTGHTIGVYDNDIGQTFNIKETITTLVDNTDGTFIYTNEDGDTTTVNTNPNFTMGTNMVDTDPNTNGDIEGDSKTGDIYHATDESLWFYNSTQTPHWFQGGGTGEGGVPPMYDSLAEAFANLGPGERFMYSISNIDGAVAFSQAWTPII